MILLALAALLWAGNFVVSRAGVGTLPPIGLAFWRWITAFMFVACVGHKHIRKDLPILKRAWRRIIVLSILGISSYNTLLYVGLQTTTAMNALLLQSVMPIIILCIAWIFLGERMSGQQAFGIAISLAGVFLIAARGDIFALGSLTLSRGDLWVVVAVFAYAIYSVALWGKPDTHPLSLLAATFAVGVIILFPLYIHEHLTDEQMHLNKTTLLSVLYVAAGPGFLAYLCYNRGVVLLGPARAGQFLHLIPLFGSIMAVLILGEKLMIYHGAGASLIIIGLYLADRSRYN